MYNAVDIFQMEGYGNSVEFIDISILEETET